MKIKASYTTDEELDALIRFLSPVTVSYKTPKKQEGRYKKTYFDIDIERRSGDASIQRR